MNQVLEVIQKAGMFTLATLKNGVPTQRPFGELFSFEGKLYFNTNNQKAVYQELKQDPHVSLCAFYLGTWVRVSAIAVEDDRAEARQAALLNSPGLKKMYRADDGRFVVFAVTQATAEIHAGMQSAQVINWA